MICRPVIRLSIISLAMLGVSGCGTMQQLNRDSLQQYHATNSQLAAAMDHHPAPPESMQLNYPYVSVEPVTHVDSMPSVLEQSASIHTPAGSAWDVLQILQRVLGLDIHADDDVLDGSPESSHTGAQSPSIDATLQPPSSVLVRGGSSHVPARLAAIARKDTTKGLLDYVAAQLDATWQYDSRTRTVHIYRYESRVMPIAAVPGDATTDTSIESGQTQQIQGGQGQTVSVGQTPSHTKFSGTLNVWKSLVTNISPMLSRSGSLQINEPTASITVRDRWDRVDAIQQYVDRMNLSLHNQVEVNVKIYRIQVNDSDNHGIDWSILYNTLGQAATSAGASLSTPAPVATGLSSLILNAPTKNKNGGTALFSGSQFFFKALSSLGKVSNVTDSTIDTVNNMPAPFQVMHSVAYVASTTSLYTSGVSSGSSTVVGAGATLQPGEVQTGFDLLVLPSVQADGHLLLLQTMLSVSTLDSMSTFTSGGNSVQQPNVSARKFLNRSWLKSGQSLVLAGFQDSEADNTTSSPLDKSMWMVAGNRSVSNTKDEIVVVITPVVTRPQAVIGGTTIARSTD